MRRLGALLAACALAAAGCGDDTGSNDAPRVFAASSLRDVLPRVVPGATFNFAGSNELLTQIERGARADVLAAAGPKEPQALARDGKCRRPPVAYASNALAILVPEGNPGDVTDLRALARGRRRIAVAAEGVPVGDYTRALLADLGLEAVLTTNVVSNEPDVAGVTAKVALGSADAGFAYVTDAKAAGDRVEAIAIPAGDQPPIRYEACALTDRGLAVVDALTGDEGRRRLEAAGFGPPP